MTGKHLVLKDPPAFTPDDTTNLKAFVQKTQALRETVQLLIGTRGPNRGNTAWGQALIDANLTGPDGGTVPVDLTPPPAPTGFAVGAAISHIFAGCDPETYLNGGGHLEAVLYGATYPGTGPLPTFATAVELTRFPGQFFAYPTNPATEWHLWLTWVSKAHVEGLPAGGTNGLVATTGQDVTTLLDALTAAAFNPASPYDVLALRADLFTICPTVDYYQSATPGSPTTGQLWLNPTTGITQRWSGTAWVAFAVNPPFFVTTVPIVQNGVTAPPGVYLTDAFIANGTIAHAQIGLLQVDDANVANMNVAKLIAGSLAVGQWIRSSNYIPGVSGFTIDASGFMELSFLFVRDQLQVGQAAVGVGTNTVRNFNINNGAGVAIPNLALTWAPGSQLSTTVAVTSAGYLQVTSDVFMNLNIAAGVDWVQWQWFVELRDITAGGPPIAASGANRSSKAVVLTGFPPLPRGVSESFSATVVTTSGELIAGHTYQMDFTPAISCYDAAGAPIAPGAGNNMLVSANLAWIEMKI